MDPNEALEQIRQALVQYYQATTNEEAAEAGGALAGHVGALDRWLSRGGFLPQAWDRRDATQREQYAAEVKAGRIREAYYV